MLKRLLLALASASLLQISGVHATENPDADDAIIHLKRALAEDRDQPLAWRLLSQAFDAKHMDGQARLAEAEYDYSIGDFQRAKAFAMRAREFLQQNTPDWRRATDIVLVSKPTNNDLRALAQGERDGS